MPTPWPAPLPSIRNAAGAGAGAAAAELPSSASIAGVSTSASAPARRARIIRTIRLASPGSAFGSTRLLGCRPAKSVALADLRQEGAEGFVPGSQGWDADEAGEAVVQDGPGGARGGAGELVGGDRLDAGGVLAGGLQDRPGQVVPGARAAAGEVVGAVLTGPHQRPQAGGQVRRPGGAADLVGDHLEQRPLAGQPQDRLDEVAAGVAVHPGGADQVVAAPDLAQGLLAGQLGAAVDAGRLGRVVLAVALRSAQARLPVEDVVGGEVQQLGVDLRAGQGEVARAEAVVAEGAVRVALATVHVGPRGRVQHQVG